MISRKPKISMDQPVTPEQVAAIDKLVAPEFAIGKWETVESETKMGSELLDEVIQEPTLDRWLDNSPKVGNPIDYPALVANLQYKRKMFITAEQKKKEPKSDE